MKLKIFFGQIFITIILLISYRQEVYSQVISSGDWKQPGLFFGVSVGQSKSQIINSETQSVPNIFSSKKNSTSASMEIGYFFSKYFGLTTGVFYDSYKGQLNLYAYQNQFNTVDIENESYEMRVSGSDIKELQQVDVVGVPFYLNIRMPLNKIIGFYLQTGVKLALPLTKNYKSSGTFSYKGYFPAYNVVLENLPEYGFASNITSQTADKLELTSVSFNAIASAGFDVLIQERIQIILGVYYDKSLANIAKYASPEEFQLSTSVDKLNSIMAGSSKTNLQSIGLKIGLRYYLSSYTKNKYYSNHKPNKYLRRYRHKQKIYLE